jgi:hypothetical protein
VDIILPLPILKEEIICVYIYTSISDDDSLEPNIDKQERLKLLIRADISSHYSNPTAPKFRASMAPRKAPQNHF